MFFCHLLKLLELLNNKMSLKNCGTHPMHLTTEMKIFMSKLCKCIP